jgi:biotin transport system substrate-specific component
MKNIFKQLTIYEILKKVLVNNILSQLFLAVAFISLLSRISIPFITVPMTLQTFAIMLVASKLNWKMSTNAIVLYLTAALCGAPILADGSFGFAVMTGTTMGYLIGFIFQAGITSYLIHEWNFKKFHLIVFANIVGTIILYSLGILHLTNLFGFKQAIEFGLYPFIAAEVIKIITASAISYNFIKK